MVALVGFLLLVPICEVDGFHCLYLPVPPLGVLARELLVREGGETIDGVGSPYIVVVPEVAGG